MGIKSLKWAFRPKEFTNSKTEEHGIHYSRYIASWYNAGGESPTTLNGNTSFCKWLESIGLTEDEIYDISKMAMCGKMELENSAKEFILKG